MIQGLLNKNICNSSGNIKKDIGTYLVSIQSKIEGRVINSDAEPVANICVELGLSNNIPATYYPYRVEKTDQDGKFLFNNL